MRKNLPMILIRVIVGVVFLTEGDFEVCTARRIGRGPVCAYWAAFSACAGSLCRRGGDCGRWSADPELFRGRCGVAVADRILTAIFTTKVPILLGHHLGVFAPPKLDHYGFLTFIHEARTDLAMLFGLIAILLDSGMRISLRGK